MNAFDKTVASLIPDWPPMEPEQRRKVSARCAALVRKQISLAPFYIRFGFWMLFFAYVLFALLQKGGKHGSPPRTSNLMAFSALPLPMVSGLERLLRTTALLFYFEQPEVLAALGEEAIPSRQAVFRTKRTSVVT